MHNYRFTVFSLVSVLYWPASLPADEQAMQFNYFPEGHIYPHYIANPLRSSFSFQPLYFSNSSVPQSGDNRFDLNMGGNLSIARLHPADSPLSGWEVSLEAGFRGQFDIDHSEDNIGWDGHYALFLDYRPNKTIAYRVGVHHTSSHIGDEYAERTGRQRINYTRQEIRLGSTWNFAENWQTYLEYARTNDRRNKALQRSGRAEWGLQYDQARLFGEQIGGYAAIDISSYEENSWSTNTTLQAGLSWPSGKRHWRLGIEYYTGRSQLGEFFQYDEQYLSIGLWMDL